MTDMTLAELVNNWEDAKFDTHHAAVEMHAANAKHERCALAQKAAYKAMKEAIDALRPKRKKPITTQDGTKLEPTPLEQSIAEAKAADEYPTAISMVA